MTRSWQTTTLGNICILRGGAAFSKDLQGSSFGDLPFIKVSDFELPDNSFRINSANNWISIEDARAIKAKPHPSGSTVFAKIGVALLSNRRRLLVRDTIVDNNVMSAAPRSNIDERFLYYLLSTLDFGQHAEGSALPYLRAADLNAIPLEVPPPDEQRAIANVLGALDDKIEQNRRTTRALERLARAIFRAWFVDFEPVKAKAAGATGFRSMPQPVFDALPTRFVASAIGPVPEGWELTAVSSAFDVNPIRPLRKDEPAPYLDMKNMPTEGHAPESWIERPFGSGMRFTNGDTLVARITPCLENGKTAFVDFLDDGQIAWGSTEYIVLRPKPPLPPIFAYCLARTREFRDFAIQNMTGSSGRQRVALNAMDHFRIAMPSEQVALEFGAIAQPLFNCIRAGMDESRKLAKMRDYLLPKLLRGHVRVEGAHG